MENIRFKFTNSIFLFLIIFSQVKADSIYSWIDPEMKVKKQLNFENGFVLAETKPNVFNKVVRLQFHSDIDKYNFLSHKIELRKYDNITYFFIRDLNILYLLDEKNAQFCRFDINTIPDGFFENNLWDEFKDYSFLIILILLVLIILNKIIYKIWILITNRKTLIRKPKYFDEFIHLFMSNGMDYTCTTLTLNELLGIEKKSYETQRQLRSKFIRNGNRYLFEKLNIRNAIIRKTNESDKRFVSYQLSKKAFEKLHLKLTTSFSM